MANQPQDVGGDVTSAPPVVSPRERLEEVAKKKLTAEQKMFVRYDAWCDPRVRAFLVDKKKKPLSREAKQLFEGDLKKLPPLEPGILRCAFALLTPMPLDRARMLANGEDYGVPVRVEGDELPAMLNALKLTSSDVIRRLAEYQYTIFNLHFSSFDLPSADLELAFVRFSTGELRISGDGYEWMNAEPDSAYFFLFAEFCLQAAWVSARPSARWWLALGGLFAAMQDVYCQRYHRKAGGRRWNDYADRWYDGSRAISDDVLLQQVQSVRRRDTTIHALVERITWNAYWYFFDDVAPSRP